MVRISLKIVLVVLTFVYATRIVISWLQGSELSQDLSKTSIHVFDWNDDNETTTKTTHLKDNKLQSTASPPSVARRLRSSRQRRPKNGLTRCPKSGLKLVGLLTVDTTVPNLKDIEKPWHEKSWVGKGGTWSPTHCQGVKVALVVPYRTRYQHLKIFLRHIHPMLKRQLLDYRIFLVEQNGQTPFNRAMLLNIGYKEALKFNDFNCFVFHDVDLIPESDHNYYGCPTSPRHLSAAVDKFDYRLPYKTLFGGVSAFKRKHFEMINGFSNRFWGWGGEDDDLYHRITEKHLNLTRPSARIGRYQMLKLSHRSAVDNPRRHGKLLNSQRRMKVDGLNTLKYKIVQTVEHPLYTLITVDIQPNIYYVATVDDVR